jgi:hypothetical protein
MKVGLLFAYLLAASGAATAQIRDDLDEHHQLIGGEVDAAIAQSERHGEVDTKERRDLIMATAEWFECAKHYAEVGYLYGTSGISKQDALIAVLSCVQERSKVQATAKAYSLVNGNPKAADNKAMNVEYDLRNRLADRLREEISWEQANRKPNE